ncbi:hypothetical protein [Flavobacterium sp.]|uniref:hypothetical protein n=1 Tax=Flavobacterium sp. TaxID=239 RepID=UPI00262F3DE4|nr:hypothetical protein [Flavobacterium sp.]
MEKQFRGIILFNIELNGNLNGVYTNNLTPNAEIYTETAKLKDDTLVENGTEVHIYDSFYFDAVEGRVDCTLTFRITNGIYIAEWRLLGNEKTLFIGEGFLMNNRQIAISYWLA